MCVRRRKRRQAKKRNPAALKTNHQKKHSSTVTVANSRRRTTKQVPRDSPSTSASLGAGFVEISHVQLSPSMILRKKKNGGRQTDTQTNEMVEACTHRDIKRRLFPAGKERPPCMYKTHHYFICFNSAEGTTRRRFRLGPLTEAYEMGRRGREQLRARVFRG